MWGRVRVQRHLVTLFSFCSDVALYAVIAGSDSHEGHREAGVP